jgi:hypothetical protein
VPSQDSPRSSAPFAGPHLDLEAALEQDPTSGVNDLPKGSDEPTRSRKASHEMDGGAVLNGDVSVSTAKTHLVSAIDGWNSNKLIKITLFPLGTKLPDQGNSMS